MVISVGEPQTIRAVGANTCRPAAGGKKPATPAISCVALAFGSGGESTLTVLVALASNAAIAVAKGVAAVVSGSAAMAAETAH